jgi:hypothetical protein
VKDETRKNEEPIHNEAATALQEFSGFALLQSNTTFTPNQFFDVVLRHSSRGCVRLVAYMIRRSLGWCDKNGKAREEQMQVSYNQLVSDAGISKGALRPAIDEAVEKHFIRRVVDPSPSLAGKTAVKGVYEIAWDGGGEYIKDITRFRGFYEGPGHRTDIPNQFFDHVVRHEALAVSKVVGAIIRFSIGFQAKRGARRQHVELSYSDLERFARLGSRAVSEGLHRALKKNYIVRVQQGVFDTNAGRESVPSTFGLKWHDTGKSSSGSKRKAVQKPRFIPNQFKKEGEDCTDKRFNKESGTGSIMNVANQFKKESHLETKLKNETLKLQKTEGTEGAEQLEKMGFAGAVAEKLASSFPLEQIQRQIDWLPQRPAVRNPLGLLRTAIEQDWPAPTISIPAKESAECPGALEFARGFIAGFTGNSGVPVAEPSARDLTAAALQLSRTAASMPDVAPKPERWGKLLGRMAANEGQRIASVDVAVRYRGDKLLALLKVRESRQVARCDNHDDDSARKEHQHRIDADYLNFLRKEEARIRRDQPDKMTAFEVMRVRKREAAKESHQPWFNERYFANFDREETRLHELARYCELPDFQKWDATINSEPLSKAA